MRVLYYLLIGMALFFILAYAGQKYLSTSCKVIDKELTRLEMNIDNQKWKNASDALDSVNKDWKKIRTPWGLIVDHWEIDAIEVSLVRLERFIQTGSKTDALVEFATLKESFNHIPKKESLSWESIL